MTRPSDVIGFADLHNHQFADQAFGGKVFYGTAAGELAALANCRADHGRHGLLDLTGNFARVVLDHRSLAALLGHRTRGWPEFTDWPRWDDYTHQGVHQAWLRRAVDGGLRLMVMLAVHNVALCRATHPPWRRHSCDTYSAICAQLDAARALERAIDEESGGTGRGWYRIVHDPDEAGEVIASGRLAVVLGAEVDDLFALAGGDSQADDVVEQCQSLGLHHILPVHFTDNRAAGAAFQPLSWASDQLPLSRANPPGAVPLYRVHTTDGLSHGYTYRGGRINRLGLTDVGRRLVSQLLRRGIIVDVDHMSTRARSDTLDLAEKLHKPLVAGHTSFLGISRAGECNERMLSDDEYDRIVTLGGMVAPIVRQSSVAASHLDGQTPSDTARGLLAAYRYAIANGQGGSIGIGTDLNGFAGGTRPRGGTAADTNNPVVAYPFASQLLGSEPMSRAVSGTRTFDINIDGLAHVGLLPDLVAELRTLGASNTELMPLMSSAQGYLDVWRACRA